jgi:LAS superfamily LD-carboxypeptidase LdcB
MLKIGMDKTDRTFRKFEYDDERMYGDPKKFKVLYEETGVYGEVLCSNVISIKKSTNTHNHFLDIPVYNENKTIESKPEPKVTLSDDVNDLAKLLEEPVDKKKPKSSTKSKAKTKDKGIPLTGTPIENKVPTIELSPTYKSYEYDILTIDNISYVDDIKSKLNEYGKDGWEVCGFQAVNKLFGCQVIIIMKKGVN